mmetsp:Transcript_96869/g.134484  ORF Transcript_96869/g.134484 Transcript_96869/m.134484 type:complete len:214 (+) Transcript_96869:173-814(+)
MPCASRLPSGFHQRRDYALHIATELGKQTSGAHRPAALRARTACTKGTQLCPLIAPAPCQGSIHFSSNLDGTALMLERCLRRSGLGLGCSLGGAASRTQRAQSLLLDDPSTALILVHMTGRRGDVLHAHSLPIRRRRGGRRRGCGISGALSRNNKGGPQAVAKAGACGHVHQAPKRLVAPWRRRRRELERHVDFPTRGHSASHGDVRGMRQTV